MSTKVCSRCKQEKPLSDFYYRKKRSRYRSACKVCIAAYKKITGPATQKRYYDSAKGKATRKRYYAQNREKIITAQKEYKIKNKDILAKKRKEWYSENRDEILSKRRLWNLTPEGRYKQYKYKAKERGLSFELSFEQFCGLWQKPCTYCGASIDTIGIDRVDNSIGYNIKNIVSCCFSCNTKKGQMTCEQWNRTLKKEIV